MLKKFYTIEGKPVLINVDKLVYVTETEYSDGSRSTTVHLDGGQLVKLELSIDQFEFIMNKK